MPEFLHADDARIAYERVGQGPPLVLMHGAEASRQMFAALVPLLAGRFTVIAYDQRDCGETEAPPRAATLADLAADAAALIRGVAGGRAHVFGSSFGGRVAQALALLHPGCVDRLVLASTWPLPHAYEALYPEGAAGIAALRARLPDSAEELAGWFFPEPFLRERPELRRVFATARADTERSRRRAQTVKSTLQCSSGAIARSPTLVIAGDLDRVVPPQLTMQLADAIPGCERRMLPGIGHVSVMQAPEQVAAALTDFLLIPTMEATHAGRR
ncbi:MAG TPA: alpha/beta hydrolase [Caldimonas sp.]|nr:alpha/beta hydrolase [Caldimonas sp.]